MGMAHAAHVGKLLGGERAPLVHLHLQAEYSLLQLLHAAFGILHLGFFQWRGQVAQRVAAGAGEIVAHTTRLMTQFR